MLVRRWVDYMNLIQIIQNKYITIAISGVIGGIITWFIQRVLNKRGTFSYFVNHLRVGMTTEDKIFGSIAVTWNGHPIPNLFLSTIELANESLNDYENVIVHIYTSDTELLSEHTQIIDTPNILEWTDKYRKQVHVEPGQSPNDNQKLIYFGQREYIIPVMNRGQKIRITYLNSAKGSKVPTIWVSVLQKGVKLKFRVLQRNIFGIPQTHAALAGLVIGVAVIIVLGLFVSNHWIAIVVALTYGLIAQLPGAYILKFLQKIREAIGN